MPSFPKPPKRERAPRKRLARRTRVRSVSTKQRAKIKQRTTVTRPSMLEEDSHRCRACKMDEYSAPGYKWLELNEHPPRSRGGDMNNPAHLITLCASLGGNGCHQKYTAGKLKIEVIDQERGCRAPVNFTEGDRTWVG
jgi:hypothetical protein